MTLAALLVLLAKVTLVLAVALLLVRLLHVASAGVRHMIWLIAITAVLLIPAIEWLTPVRWEVLPASLPATVQASTVDAPSTAIDLATPPPIDPQTIASVPLDAPTGEPTVAARLEQAGLSMGTALGLLWLGGVLAIAAWLAQGWLAARRIVRRAVTIESADWRDPMYEVADRLGLSDAPRIVRSADVRMPFACGLAAPTIVLPADCDTWALDRRRAVLLHELAHVRRRDLVGHTLARLVCAVYWFHPMVWMAAARLRSESEQACDDLAVGSGARAADYAEHLLDIVTSVRADATPNVAMAMARRSEFEGRMLAILDPDRPRRGVTRRQASLLVTAMGALTVLVAAAAPATPTRQSDPLRGTNVATSAGASGDAPLVDGDTGRAMRNPTPSPRPMPSPRPTAEPLDPLDIAVGSEIDMRSIERAAERSADEGARMAGRVVGEIMRGGRSDDGTPPAERLALLTRIARSDSSAGVRRVAVWGLEDFAADYAEARSTLVAVVRSDASGSTREMAAWALASARGSDDAIDALASAVESDKDAKVRRTAAWTLGQMRATDATAELTSALGDPDHDVRERAAWALGTIGVTKSSPALLGLLKDPARDIRRVAAWTIRRSGDVSAVPAIRAAMSVETDDDLRLVYLRTLTVLGANSPEAIQSLLDSGDPKLREEAIRLLAGARRPDPWPWPWPDPRPSP
jgi:beta-lactamase regulating signal transducer with metallopeptidase domain